MPIAIYVNEKSHVEPLVNWGIRAATAEHDALLVIVPRRQKGSPKWDPLLKEEAEENEIFAAVFEFLGGCERVVLKEDIAESSESSDMDRIVVETRELVAPNPAEAFVDMVQTIEATRLILPAVSNLKSSNEDASWAQRLFMQAPCETMMVWGCPPPLDKPFKVLVAADSETESPLAARRAVQLARSTDDGKATLLYAWPDDDDVADQIAAKKVKSILASTGSSKKDLESITWLGDSMVEGIHAQESKIYDTVIFGSRNIKKILSLARGLRNKDDGKSMAVIRPSVSISRKMLRDCQTWIRQLVPQLDREERISLVEKLETNSKFNFDFCALISLSTLIAALGLWDDSTAVVIGAMLVAPLMTPLVGIGFALIQGNLDLIRKARWAVLVGFANAFAIGFFVGLMMLLFSEAKISPEMAGRDSPGLVDLFVALASGIAGAYAMSRKDLNGAIPGVAIAAALIPPIATSGMSLAIGQLTLCIGAFLLFLTNVVFIVLGTSVVFWSIGIDTRLQKTGKEAQKQYLWTRYWFATFVIVSTILATWMALFNHPFEQDKNPEQNNTETQQVQSRTESQEHATKYFY